MHNRKLLIGLVLLLTVIPSGAQEHVIEFLPDKKIINVGKLNLPDYMTADNILQILPEFVVRGDRLYSNYDIQYDGKSVGESRDAILLQTRLCEIEKIEISTSSTSTQQHSTYSGTINIVPKHLEVGFEGEAFFDLTSEPDIMPSVNLNYRKDKFQMRGLASVEGYWPSSLRLSTRQNPDELSEGADETCRKYFQETARVNVQYDITGRDILKGWFIESWDHDASEMISRTHSERFNPKNPGTAVIMDQSDTTFSTNRTMLMQARAQYEHIINEDSKLTAYAGYQTNPGSRNGIGRTNNNFDGEFKGTFPVFHKAKSKGTMETGVNMTLGGKSFDDIRNSSTFVSPFAKFKYTGEKWAVNVGVRYQYYRSDNVFQDQATDQSADHDILASAEAVWRISGNHALQITLNRSIIRPDDEMLYPKLHYSQYKGEWIKGNPMLNPAYIHTAEVGYIFDWDNNGHSVIINAGVGYIRADGLIEEQLYDANQEPDKASGTYYVTYDNAGINNIGTINLSAIYRYGIFTLSLAGNLFTKLMLHGTSSDFSTNGNVSFSPIFNFEGDWTLCGKFMYNSPIVHNNMTNGDCIFAQICFAKQIGRWTIHLDFSDIFDCTTIDRSTNFDTVTSNVYDLYDRYIGAGFSYRFGGKMTAR